MDKSNQMDAFAWALKLGCPPEICNDLVKKKLQSGIGGILWDELAKRIVTTEEAKVIRKNILLHKLNHGKPNKIIQYIKNISQTKADGENLKSQINKLEEEYEQQDFAVRQKVKKLQDISSKRSEVEARRDLYKMKHDQTITQLRDCNEMRSVCQHLMPSTSKDLDPKSLMDCLEMVSGLSTGRSKQEVFNVIKNNLGHIEVPVLWHHLYQSFTKDEDTLIKFTTIKSVDTDKNNTEMSFTRMYGQYICMVSRSLSYKIKAKCYKHKVLEFIKNIEIASNGSADISEWLALALEVCKLENEQKNLQEEVNKMKESLFERNTVVTDLSLITSEIQNVNRERVECAQQIQQSLHLLKAAPSFLRKIAEKINLKLKEIATIRTNGYNLSVLSNNLTTELDIFRDALELNALRKIMLKGDIGIYRYTKSCFSEASVSVRNSQTSNIISYFPTIQIPIYSLIDCYQNLLSMLIYRRLDCSKIEENPHQLQSPILTYKENNDNTVELLKLSKLINAKTKAEIEKFNEILNAWVNQPVQKVMEIVDKTVDNATFPKWIERYDLLLYMLQNSM